ncbi:30S ribosomal protein S9 [Patescibacteria group bacterium]|nr:30S ribosomal protein S9 [Patescibacteria group bacterium]
MTELALKDKKQPIFSNLPKDKYHYANGKRKTSVVRLRLYDGQGNVFINGKPMKDYIKTGYNIAKILAPLNLVGLSKKFDIFALVTGGGDTSQAEAIRHGVAKALLEYDDTLRVTLKKAGFLSRDSRVKERKKPGLKSARRAPQWQKR